MRKNIEKVLAAFRDGKVCNEKTCWTDGTTIYSYSMPIARRDDKGVTIVKLESGPSNTTRAQIRAAELLFGKNALRVESLV